VDGVGRDHDEVAHALVVAGRPQTHTHTHTHSTQ
jgi:hypothetical protein